MLFLSVIYIRRYSMSLQKYVHVCVWSKFTVILLMSLELQCTFFSWHQQLDMPIRANAQMLLPVRNLCLWGSSLKEGGTCSWAWVPLPCESPFAIHASCRFVLARKVNSLLLSWLCASVAAWSHLRKPEARWPALDTHTACIRRMCRVGQNHIYTVYIQYFWQGNHQIYGHIRCIYTVLANCTHV